MQAKEIIDDIVKETDAGIKSAHECRQSMVDGMMTTLINNGWTPDSPAITKMVKTVRKNKARLRSVLSRHPQWSNKDQAVILPVVEQRYEFHNPLDRFILPIVEQSGEIGKDIYKITNSNKKPCTEANAQMTDQCYMFRSAIIGRSELDVTKQLTQALNSHGYPFAKLGQKMSRAINEWAIYHGYDKFHSYNKLFADLSDALNPIEIQRKSILSINPVDMLLMSYGNSWQSCHGLCKHEPRSYRSGSLSYMMDNNTMIFSTFDSECDEIHTCKRITRQLFFFDNGLLVQSRLYPNYNNIKLSDTYRDLVQRIITECLGVANRWELSRDTEKAARACITHANSTHYPDYRYYEYHCTTSTIRDMECNSTVDVGQAPRCIECGNKHGHRNTLQCTYCSELSEENEDEPYAICNSCGDSIMHEDDACYIEHEDEQYCSNCVTWCDGCDGYQLSDDIAAVQNEFYCDYCRDEYCFYCDCCNEWYLEDRIKHGTVHITHYGTKKDPYAETWCEECIHDIDSEADLCGECGEHYSGKICICEWNKQNSKEPQLVC